MKILFLDTSPIRRGAQVFITELADYLSGYGYETFRVYLYKVGKPASKLPIRSQDLELNFDSKNLLEKIPTIQPFLLMRLIKEIKGISPDVVLLNGSRTLKYGAAAKQFLPKKIRWVSRIIDNAEFWNSGKFTHWYYKNLIIPQVDATIGVSKASLNSMISHYDFKKPSQVIHRAFDPEKFKNAPNKEAARRDLGLEEEDEVLLFLGNLTAQKRPDRFIEVVQKLSQTRPNLKALIVGDGPLRAELERHAATIKSQEVTDETSATRLSDAGHPTPDICHQTSDIGHPTSNILFAGYQQDVSPYLAAADLLILNSDTEGLPGVVLEAGFFGVPTVATEVGGIRECLIDGESGILIPDRSIEGFVSAIDKLLSNPAELQAMGGKSRELVLKNFRMEEVAEKYMSFFRALK
ncbi:MAG: glycosyltransferase family 4 protein [Algoriphagus sp.]|uniref:glycosyltransferase family 4 protein n=1 Tax=Algoriphagus sp. TaxID=1872435 RepID=UPI00260451B3|nr:glycosyltransferase family 4 protein [Algoriphagus sp.]MDG1277533.1 glycosyltransferase family 4 protein [Algoriphagus sp.]